MSREFDFSKFEKFAENWLNAQKDFDRFLRIFLYQMAQRVIAKVKPRTPVDTGFLRESWGVGDIIVTGGAIEVEIVNGAEYASVIEYGTQKDSGAWREGRFMLKISIDEIQRQMPARFNEQFRDFLASWGLV